MHITRRFRSFLILTIFLGFFDQRAPDAAEAANRTPKAVGMTGRVQFARESGVFAPLLLGTELRPGDVIRTSVASAVDIDLGGGPGIVRLTENSLLMLDRLPMTSTNGSNSMQADVSLNEGELLGNFKAGQVDSRLEIKTPLGIAQVVHGQFRVQSRAYLVLVEGKMLFAHVPPGGQPAAHTLSAPPACYFTPVGGIRPAPRELVHEVKSQLKAKLGK